MEQGYWFRLCLAVCMFVCLFLMHIQRSIEITRSVFIIGTYNYLQAAVMWLTVCVKHCLYKTRRQIIISPVRALEL